jgi:hypothetical protein
VSHYQQLVDITRAERVEMEQNDGSFTQQRTKQTTNCISLQHFSYVLTFQDSSVVTIRTPISRGCCRFIESQQIKKEEEEIIEEK